MNKKPKYKRIYIDANVIIDYYTSKRLYLKDKQLSFEYIVSRRNDIELYTSTAIITQVIAQLQKKMGKRKKFTKEEIKVVYKEIITKLNIIQDLRTIDIENALSKAGEDVEDCIQYVLSQKVYCEAIITNNVADFLPFEIPIIKNEIGFIKKALGAK